MFLENLKEAITSIFSNKMRSILTMLGIIIGISSVITITTIGSSIRSTLSSTMNSLGGNTIEAYLSPVYPENDEEWDTWDYPEMEDEDYMSQDMIDALLEAYPDELSEVINNMSLTSGQIKDSSTRYANVSVSGVTPGMLDYLKLKIKYGRSLSQADNDGAKKACIIADQMVENYFTDEDPLGKTISVESQDGSSYDFVVVGVYEYNEAVFGKADVSVAEKDRVTEVYVPYNTALKLAGQNSGFSDFLVSVNPLADINEATQHVNEFLNEYYQYNRNWEVTTYNMASELKIIDTIINIVTVAISGIAAISLIVGGVGVMNIMLVSITERTREIGVRMALGAKRRTIRLQFVIEAIVLCLIGGLIGILFGIGCGLLLGKIAEIVVQAMYAEYTAYIVISVHPSLTAILLSLFFSMLTGVFFGYYPANKASKMEVIDALRYE